VAITIREYISASKNNWQALLLDNGEIFHSQQYALDIVDRVGAGDSFAAGLIYGHLNNLAPQKALQFAVAASALKHSIEGDFDLVNLDEVNALLKD
jgi:2-dehydro-3-deoxygluconokinase